MRELEKGELRDLAGNCRKLRIVVVKDSINIVVRSFCRRGAMSPTRLGVLVVSAVGSCLGLDVIVGREDGDLGGRDCRKRGKC